MDFLLPSAHVRTGDPRFAGFTSPTAFRIQGLATLLTVSALRSRAGFVSHRQRSWDSPFGAFPSRKVFNRFRPKEPTYR